MFLTHYKADHSRTHVLIDEVCFSLIIIKLIIHGLIDEVCFSLIILTLTETVTSILAPCHTYSHVKSLSTVVLKKARILQMCM